MENDSRRPQTARVSGVFPRGEYDRPLTSVLETAVSSAQWISQPSSLALRAIRGYSVSSHALTASGCCS